MTRKEERTENAVKYGYEAFANSFNCGQSSLAGLLKEFKPELEEEKRDELIKAASLVYGVGGRGETCGTIQGSIMFLGVLYGKDMTQDALVPANAMKFINKVSIITEFANNMEKIWGSTRCSEIHGQIMGRHYDMEQFKDLMAFYNDGASEKCQKAVEVAIREVCRMIMDDEGNIIER